VYIIDQLAERIIAAAMGRGELDNLPGAGAPLELGDDALVPEELRAGYRLLKNAGYLPADLELRREIESVEALLVQARCVEERDSLSKRLRYLLLQLGLSNNTAPLLSEAFYRDKLHGRAR
jgi:hypothetical protein